MKRSQTTISGLFLGLTSLCLWAQPGSGVRIGEQTVLIPEVSASFNYNDNVNLRRRAVSEGGEFLDRNESDWFLNTQLSLSLRRWANQTQWNARIWYGERRYDKRDNLDRDTYGISTGLNWLNPAATTDVSWSASLQRAVDRSETPISFIGDSETTEELENVAERVERDEIRSNITLGQQLTPTVRGILGYHITDIQYKDDRFNDRTSHLITGELTYQFSDKTAPYFRAGIGLDDDEGLDGLAERPFFLFGIRYRATDKLSLDLGVGYESFSRTPIEFFPDPDGNTQRQPGEELSDSGLKFTANVQYAATAKTRVSLSARNGFGSVASPGSSSREEISASAALIHQTTRQLSQRLSVAWREDDYLTPLPARGELFDERKQTVWYQYRVDYQTVRPWLSLFGNLSYEDGSSRIPGDSYTETQVTLGLRARY